MHEKIDFSIIVASHRPNFLPGLLHSFRELDFPKDSFEVIVVADYSVDSFIKYFPDYNFIYIDDTSIPKKRNIGISRAKFEICAFVDDDCRVSADWLNRADELFNTNTNVAGIEGFTSVEKFTDANRYNLNEYKRLESRGYRTNNIFYRKSILESVGCFDNRFKFQREDSDLAFSILKKGYEIIYSDTITITHLYRKEHWNMLKTLIKRRFDPLLFKKHPKMYREYIVTPAPLTVNILLLTYLLTGCVVIATDFYMVIFIPLMFSLLAAIRKCSSKPSEFLEQFLSYIISPFLFTYVMMYGSVKYRRFLFF